MNENNKYFTCFGMAVFLIISVVVGAFMEGWVLSILWGWFISPVFGLPILSIPSAIGVAIVIGMMTKQDVNNNKKKDEELSSIISSIIARAVFSPLLVLFIGWIVKSFV